MIAAIRRREPRPVADDAMNSDALQLATLVRECVVAGIGRRACVVYLSRLPAERAKPHHLRLVRAAMEPLAHADRARMFALPNQDLVAVWRGPAEVALATSRTAIAHLFGEGDDAGTAAPVLWEELDLPKDAARLLAIAERPKGMSEALPPTAAPPLDPAALAKMEAGLNQADMSRFARRRQVCLRLPDGRFRLRWEKRYLSVDEMAESLVPNHSPQADPWLFRRLTRTLDRRMLALLSAPGELADAGPFAINLNVSSILAPEFLRFDRALPVGLRGQVVLDLLPADVLSDPGAFLFARDFARSRGYRILLRGITADLLALFPSTRMGVDHLQLRWAPDLIGSACRIEAAEARVIILGHVDSPEAIAWGVGQGITTFQGSLAVAAHTRLPHPLD